jgi:3-oxoadipate enol-lactonase
VSVDLKHYEQGSPDAPAVVLAPALGTTLALWDHLAAALSDTFRVVRVDLRGHGGSAGAPERPTVADLGEDVLAVADDLGLDDFAFVGISLGGAIGLSLALDHPARVTSLVLVDSAARFGDPETWTERAARVRAEGMAWLDGPTRERWFTEAFRTERPREVDRVMRMLAATSPAGYAACCDALASYDVTGRLGEVRVPTLVLTGGEDPTAGPEVARVLADGIPGAELVVLDRVAHLANVAAPDAVHAAVRRHLLG